ncbi:MAG: cupin domain-containing protein [Bacteriovoracaceae bacterium]|jgi:50S ribosomal protein L16 3-hydroxylase|nr:cupin domain-containing protein [Bacteriovoracaceae bacterium]
MENNVEQVLGGMTPEIFLKEYWQKKPLFVKGAFSNTMGLATPENLMDMGQDENFFTRMVWSEGGTKPWEAKAGPFTDDQFTRNEKDKWTLIVHSLELYFKEFREIRDMMKFVPTWQFDDIMATYSVKGASVGAHIDNYNVFIFQGKGKRLWQINENPDEAYVEGLDIKLLSNFEIGAEYELEEGDLLYLPPGVAHHGITLEESISYSIGFRSFDYPDLAGAFFTDFLTTYDSSKCLKFKSPDLPKNIHEYTDESVEDIINFFKNEILTKEVMTDWFGRYITSTNHEVSSDEELPASEIYQNLESGVPLFRDVHLRFNFHREGDANVRLFANGHDYKLSNSEYDVVEKMLNTPGYEAIKITAPLPSSVKETIVSLVNQGVLFFDRD